MARLGIARFQRLIDVVCWDLLVINLTARDVQVRAKDGFTEWPCLVEGEGQGGCG